MVDPARHDKNGKPIRRPVVVDGVRMCRWCCMSPIEKGRRKYCSSLCATSALWLRIWDNVVTLIWLRDRVCQICGFDPRRYSRYDDGRGIPVCKSPEWYELLRKGFDLTTRISLMDVHHIVPKSVGGDRWRLENLQLLCQPCHKKITAESRRKNGQTEICSSSGRCVP